MEVLLTFDVEVWCNGWESIEADFPDSFERYVFGHSRRDGYALPRTLDTLARHGLKGIFFAEPLFAARFGVEHLATIVRFIEDAGQEVQLHLHPEWTDEARPALLPGTTGKRQHLTSYSLAEQQTLIAHGLRLLREAGCKPPVAFRAGSFACNPDTFAAAPPDDAWLAGLLAKKHVAVLVALSGSEVVGGLVAYELDKLERARRELYIYDLAVAAAHRRRGIATALIGRLRTIAARRDAWVIYVQADYGDEPAIALYEKLGTREDVMHFDIGVVSPG